MHLAHNKNQNRYLPHIHRLMERASGEGKSKDSGGDDNW